MADRANRKWLEARVRLLSELLGGVALRVESNNPGDYRRYRLTNESGSHNYHSRSYKAVEFEIWLSGAIDVLREFNLARGRK